MSALENLSNSDALTQVPAGGAGAGAGAGAPRPPPGPPPGPPPPPKKAVDPLKDYRNMLSAGSVLNVWTKGKFKPSHVLVSSDWRNIVWQDPKTGKKLGAMDLRSAAEVSEGPAAGHKKRLGLGRKVKPECAFSVVGDRHNLDLEVMVAAQRKRWVKALQTLITVFKTNPDALR